MNSGADRPVAGSSLPRPSRWRSVRRILIALVVGSLTIVGLMMIFEEKLIFFPTKYHGGDWQPAGLNFEDAWFSADDATKLHGWYVPHDSPRAVVLFAHGNAGNISHRADLLQALHEMGLSVLAFDYRGYGRSEGTPNEAGVLADGRAARKWLADRAGISEPEIVLLGESLGGAVATALAAEAPARGLILENTFSSVPDVAAVHYSVLPVQLLMRNRFESAKAIKNYHGPLLQVHGDADTIVPYALGRKLFAAANQPKQFVTIAGGNHNDPRSRQFFEALNKFLDGLSGL